MNYSKKTSSAWFSIIEVLIGIFVFTLGLVAVYALISSSLRVNNYNKHAIVASNLAREQIELIKNIRDTNYEQLKVWNAIESWNLETDKYYKIFLKNSDADISLQEQTAWDENDISKNTAYKICWDASNAYNYCDQITWDKTKTPYYKYVYISQAKDSLNAPIEDSYIIISKVIWYSYGAHEFEIKTLLSDWRRI